MKDEDFEKDVEILKKEGYNAMMKQVDDIRKSTFKLFYEIFSKKWGKTKHQLNEILVDRGIQAYNKSFAGVSCNTVEEVQKDLGKTIELSFIDTISVLQDRGLLEILMEEYGTYNANDFLRKFKQ